MKLLIERSIIPSLEAFEIVADINLLRWLFAQINVSRLGIPLPKSAGRLPENMFSSSTTALSADMLKMLVGMEPVSLHPDNDRICSFLRLPSSTWYLSCQVKKYIYE